MYIRVSFCTVKFGGFESRAALESLSPLRSVRLSKAFNCNPKCVYHVLTQIVYNVTLDTQIAPTGWIELIVRCAGVELVRDDWRRANAVRPYNLVTTKI